MTTLGRALAAPILARGRLRADAVPVAVVALLVAVTAFLGAALPRLLEASAEAGIRTTVAAVPSTARDLLFERDGSIEAAPGDPLAGVVAAGAALRDGLPDKVRALAGTPGMTVDTIEHVVTGAPVVTTAVRFRIQPGVDPLIAWVEGRAPAAAVGETTLEILDPRGEPYEARVYEAAVSSGTAAALRLAVGDRYVLRPTPDDTLTATIGSRNLGYAVLEIVGRFDVLDPEDPAWFGDPGLHGASVEVVAFETYVYHVHMLVDPEVYPVLVGPQPGSSTVDPVFPMRYRWRLPVDADRIEGRDLGGLLTSLARLRAAYPALVVGAGDTPRLATSLDRIVAGYRERRVTTESVLAAAAVGPAVAGAGLLALVALLVARRRAATTSVVRSRGASTAQVLGSRLVEGVVVAGSAAGVGLVAAIALVPAPTPTAGASVAAGVAVVAVALLVAAAWPDARSGSRPVDASRATLRPSPRRLVVDGLVVALAIAGVVALVGRGLQPTGTGDTDPLRAAAPALLAVAGALLIVRLLPFPVALVAAAASRLRGLVPLLAARLAARNPSGSSIPLLVVIVATAVTVFSSVALAGIEDGQARATWNAVGAEVRVEVAGGGGLPPPVAAASVPGVRAVAEARIQPVTLRGAEIRPTRGTLLALDTAAWRAVVAGSPVAGALPDLLAAPGAPGAPIPVFVAPGMLERADLDLGMAITFGGFDADLPLVVVGTIERIPGLVVTDRTVVVPLEAMRAAGPSRELRPTHLLIAADPRDGAAVADAYRDLAVPYGSLLRIEARSRWVDGLAASPLARALGIGLALAAAIALAYVALALVAGIVLAAGARAGQRAILRTLGLSRRELGGLILLEQLPLVAVAVAGGIALGLLTAGLLVPALGLDAFTGSAATGVGADLEPVPVVPIVDPVRIAVTAILPMAAVIAVVAAASWALGHRNLARSVRVGEP